MRVRHSSVRLTRSYSESHDDRQAIPASPASPHFPIQLKTLFTLLIVRPGAEPTYRAGRIEQTRVRRADGPLRGLTRIAPPRPQETAGGWAAAALYRGTVRVSSSNLNLFASSIGYPSLRLAFHWQLKCKSPELNLKNKNSPDSA